MTSVFKLIEINRLELHRDRDIQRLAVLIEEQVRENMARQVEEAVREERGRCCRIICSMGRDSTPQKIVAKIWEGYEQ